MGISIFPSTAAEFVSNNFVVDMNDTTNNVATDIGGVKQAGPYSISFSSGDTSFDVYLINEDGDSVGYSNTTSITASGLFDTVVILGVASDEIISFLYQGSVNNADETGTEPGAGAYLTSISPADLPSIDDTATVIGGNFGTATEITFESGTISLPAKNITVTNGTSIVVTRPDALIEDDAPYDLKAINTGVTPPTGTDAHILSGTVTAGSDPTWVTTSPLNQGSVGEAFSQTLSATDSDGTVVDYSVTTGTLPAGLSLNSSTGVLSGTPTSGGSSTFTITATDDGGNTTDREFDQLVVAATGGTIIDLGGGQFAHVFDSTGTFEPKQELTGVEYVVVAGGGGGGDGQSGAGANGSGGAGGYRSSVAGEASGGGASAESTLTLAADTPITITVGAGGAAGVSDGSGSQGSSSSIGTVVTTVGGGFGGGTGQSGGNGGSGGGGGGSGGAGSGTSGEGFNGKNDRGGGGGAAQAGGFGNVGGDGVESSITGTAVFRAGGANGGDGIAIGGGGFSSSSSAGAGSTGQVILRYTV